MSAPKYLERDVTTGKVTEIVATETGPTPEVVVSTTPGGTIDPSLLPASGASTALTGEAIAAGAFVYIKAGISPPVPTLYNAVWSSGGNQAIGYVLLSYPTPGTMATYYNSGQNTSLSTLTAGLRYYGDSATPGGVTAVVPTGAGTLSQFLGTSVSDTAIEVNIEDSIILAS